MTTYFVVASLHMSYGCVCVYICSARYAVDRFKIRSVMIFVAAGVNPQGQILAPFYHVLQVLKVNVQLIQAIFNFVLEKELRNN